MKQLYYAFRYLLKGKKNNLIKIISLTLGLIVGLVLFSKVGFEMNYDKYFSDADRVYRIQRKIYIGDKFDSERETVYAPVANDLKSEISEIEDAVVTLNYVRESYLQYEDHFIKERMLTAGESIFDVFGIELINGDKSDLAIDGNLFLSESAAYRLFGKENAIGKTLLKEAKPYTVSGVFKDKLKGHLDFDVLLPINEDKYIKELGWHNPEAFFGYVKLLPGVSPEEVEKKIEAVLPKYVDKEKVAANDVFEFYLNPVSEIHLQNVSVKRLIIILSLLAFSLLFVAAMNYVLISISSLAKRAKSVGIHKCNGATKNSIFAMFIYETAATIFIAFVLAVFLIFVFRGFIENIIQTPVFEMFSINNLWISGVVVVSLLLLAGVIPAMIFSAVPVTHLFRAYATNKRYWKRVLLFVQFSGVAFIFTLLAIIIKQYDLLLYNDLGYATENVVYSENIQKLSRDQVSRIKTEFERMPQVVSVCVSSNLPVESMNGLGIKDITNENIVFSSRSMGIDSDFLKTLDIELLAGNNVGEESYNYTRAIVNEKFVEMMGWTGSPVGNSFLTGLSGLAPTEVIGLVKDFQLYTLYEDDLIKPISPLVIFPLEKSEDNWLFGWNRVIIRLHHLDEPLLGELNKKMQQITELPYTHFVSYQSKIKDLYRDTLLYRDSIVAASLILLIITILGLIGFVDDEINRRSKEIVIRRIIGATAKDILFIMSKSIIIISVPAILMGQLVSHSIGADWLQQFAVKIPLNIYIYAISYLIILFEIIICVTTRTWLIANENPVKNIKSE